MRKIVVLCVVSLIGFAGVVDAAEAPKKVVEVQMVQHPFDYVPEVKRNVPSWAKCPDLWNRLRDAGWLEKDVVKADAIIFVDKLSTEVYNLYRGGMTEKQIVEKIKDWNI